MSRIISRRAAFIYHTLRNRNRNCRGGGGGLINWGGGVGKFYNILFWGGGYNKWEGLENQHRSLGWGSTQVLRREKYLSSHGSGCHRGLTPCKNNLRLILGGLKV